MRGSLDEQFKQDLKDAVDSVVQLAVGAHDPEAAWRGFVQLVACHVGEQPPLRFVT